MLLVSLNRFVNPWDLTFQTCWNETLLSVSRFIMTFFDFTVQSEHTLDNDDHHSDDEIPTMTRRPLPRGRARKRAIPVEDRETGVVAESSVSHWRSLYIYILLPNISVTCFCVFWLVSLFLSRFGLQDSDQAHLAPRAHTVRDGPHNSS